MAEKKKTSKDLADADEASPGTDTATDVKPTSEDAIQNKEAPSEAADHSTASDSDAAKAQSSDDVSEDMTATVAEDASEDIASGDDTAAQDEKDDSARESPTEPSPMVTTEQVVVREGGFWSMVLGGIVAAGIGALAAPYVVPQAWFETGDSALETRIEQSLGAQDQRINALNAQIDGLTVPPDRSDEINGLGETLTALTGQISGLEERVSALESRPMAPSGGGAPAAEVEELRRALDAQRAEIEALSAEAQARKAEAQARESAAQQGAIATLRRAAMTRILTALDSGSDFAPALADLRDTGADVPDALADVADTGVPTLPALKESFPAAARSALAAARIESGQGPAGIGSFFKNQLGVRSLLPREGDDPDAVLSRIEAAVGEGRLSDALAEIELLPDVAKDKLSDWAAQATRRNEAVAAAEALAGTLN